MNITELYSREELSRLRKKQVFLRTAAILIAVLGLGACVVCCIRTGTRNAVRMEYTAIVVSTLTGWIVIAMGVFSLRPLRREIAHGEHVLAGKREKRTGVLTIGPDTLRIKGSISIRPAVLEDGPERTTLHVNARKANLLPPSGSRVTVYTVYGYAAAWEDAE